MSDERRIKSVFIAPEMIIALLTQNRINVSCIEGLPEGAKVVWARYEHNAIVLTVEHESFEPVDPHKSIPIQKIIYHAYFRDEFEDVQP